MAEAAPNPVGKLAARPNPGGGGFSGGFRVSAVNMAEAAPNPVGKLAARPEPRGKLAAPPRIPAGSWRPRPEPRGGRGPAPKPGRRGGNPRGRGVARGFLGVFALAR